MTNKSPKDRQQIYHERMKLRGMKKILIWVPKDKEAEIKKLAKEMCQKQRALNVDIDSRNQLIALRTHLNMGSS